MEVIAVILKIASALFAVVSLVCWLVALAKWDGECPCSPEDCDTCPFPHDGCMGAQNRRNE